MISTPRARVPCTDPSHTNTMSTQPSAPTVRRTHCHNKKHRKCEVPVVSNINPTVEVNCSLSFNMTESHLKDGNVVGDTRTNGSYYIPGIDTYSASPAVLVGSAVSAPLARWAVGRGVLRPRWGGVALLTLWAVCLLTAFPPPPAEAIKSLAGSWM